MGHIHAASQIRLVGAPVEEGAGRPGCALGPRALRAAGIGAALGAVDLGDVAPRQARPLCHGNAALKALPEVSAWTEALAEAALAASEGGVPVFLGGDHSLSAGTVTGMARRAAALGRPLFLLWLDAHPDFHTLDTTTSGNLHGTPAAYATGRPGFEGYFPALAAPVDPRRVCMLGVRSVDPAEAGALAEAGVAAHGVPGLGRALTAFLSRVAAEDGLLHVSLDVDFLDPGLAPAVGTTVPAGAGRRAALAAMDRLRASGRVASLDLVELNPRLDRGGRTARLMVELAARLLGRRT
ncbi:arginase [Amaricoccus sp.]|uniref:arginase n=1 Tax=Amaricoccus sp. TaxID=1872485 RepID=UPI001B4B5F9D|nr:arginase [Amaricoccus sp.]MBP7002128.1 arginase [Amaricoccus sp.]